MKTAPQFLFNLLLFPQASTETEKMSAEYFLLSQLADHYKCKSATINHVAWAVERHGQQQLFRNRLAYIKWNEIVKQWVYLAPDQEYITAASKTNKYTELGKMIPIAPQPAIQADAAEDSKSNKGKGKGKSKSKKRDLENQGETKDFKKQKLAEMNTELALLFKLKSRMAAAQSQAIVFKTKIENEEEIWKDMHSRIGPLVGALGAIDEVKRSSGFWEQFSVADASSFRASTRKMDHEKFAEEVRSKHTLLTAVESLESLNSRIQQTYAVWNGK